MLTLTQAAKDVLKDMVSVEEAPEGSGLRIAAEPGNDGDASLSLALTTAPAAGDAVLEEDGARVFLEPNAAELLEDKVLDATHHDDHVHFVVDDRTRRTG